MGGVGILFHKSVYLKVIILEQLLFLKFLNSSNKQKRVIEHTNISTERNCKNNCILKGMLLVPPKNHQSIYTMYPLFCYHHWCPAN